MRPLKNKASGLAEVPVGKYLIATTTAISVGQAVTLSAGKVVAQAVDGTAAILGVAAESHSGSASYPNPRENGTEILVYDSPNQIYECEAPEVTVTGGSTTTIISTNLVAESGSDTLVDDDLNSGYAILTYKGASSANTDAIGKVYAISDYDAGDRTITIATAGGAVTAGDKFKIVPPIGFAKGNLDSGRANIVLSASAAIPFRVVGYNLEKGTLEIMPTLHVLANKNS